MAYLQPRKHQIISYKVRNIVYNGLSFSNVLRNPRTNIVSWYDNSFLTVASL